MYVAMDLIPIVLGSLPLAHNAQHSLVINLRRACAARVTVVVLCEGSATAEKSVRDFEFTERFQDFSKDFRFQRRFQDFSKDFRFREDFCRDFKISRDFW